MTRPGVDEEPYQPATHTLRRSPHDSRSISELTRNRTPSLRKSRLYRTQVIPNFMFDLDPVVSRSMVATSVRMRSRPGHLDRPLIAWKYSGLEATWNITTMSSLATCQAIEWLRTRAVYTPGKP